MQVAFLTGITKLHMGITDGTTRLTESTASLKDLKSALQPLSQLRDLSITGCWKLQAPSVPTWRQQQLDDCAAVVCGMRHLLSLRLGGLDFTPAAMTLLAKLPHLTSLELPSCSIDDYGLSIIALHMTGEG